MPSTLDIFCCYAHQDKQLLDNLISHLMPLQRQKLIKIWHDADIGAGRAWQEQINKHLDSAHIILLLISPDFMASDYCYSHEMQHAMQRHERDEARVIPVLLRPTYWKGTPFEKLQMVPNGAKAVKDRSWHTEDEALLDVTERLSVVVSELIVTYSLNEASELIDGSFADNESYEKALDIYEQLIRREPNLTSAYLGKGKVLSGLNRYEESLQAYEKAFQIDAKVADGSFYQEKAEVLFQLQRFEESLIAYDEAIRCNPLFAETYAGKADVLEKMQQYREALAMYEQAIRLEPDNAEYYASVGGLLQGLRRLEEALDMYGKAIQLRSGWSYYCYDKKGKLLLGLKRFEEALAIYDQYIALVGTSDFFWGMLNDMRGHALLGLRRYKDALDIYEQLIGRLKSPQFHYGKGKALFDLERYEEALVAYDEAIRLSGDVVYPGLYRDKGMVYERMAKLAYEIAEKRQSQRNGKDGDNIFSSSVLPVEKLVLLYTLTEHKNTVHCIAISPDGQTLVSGGDDKIVRVWDLATRQEQYILNGHTDSISSVAISPDGQKVVSGSYDKTLRVWDLATGQVWTLNGHTGRIFSVAISPDGQTLVSGGDDNTLRIWDLARGQEPRILNGHTDSISSVAISPDGQKVVSGSFDNTIKIWSLHSGEELYTLEQKSPVYCVAISPNEDTLVSGDANNTIRIWNWHSRKELHAFSEHNNHIIYSVAISPDGQTVVSGSSDSDQFIKICHLYFRQELRTLDGHTDSVICVAISPDGQTVVSGSADRTIKIWGVR